MTITKKPTVMIILDGFGYTPESHGNAIFHAHKPHFDLFLKNYPHTLLHASGNAVGLPEKTVGNSEVGHLTLGAGRTIQQPLTRLSQEFLQGTLQTNPILTSSFEHLKKTKTALHLMGLVSDGNVHSSLEHFFGFLALAQNHTLPKVFIHCFLDGRDVAPQSAHHYLTQLDSKISELKLGSIASLHGRFYAMDRDHNWQRTQSCYETLTQKQELWFDSWHNALEFYYNQKLYDEFIPPTQIIPTGIIKKNDGILFFNLRPDRARQLTEAFTNPSFDGFQRSNLPLSFFITPISFDDNCITTPLLTPTFIKNSLLECISKAGKTIYTTAETEKYAHVTYFFNGGKEEQWPHEKRVLIPSSPLRDYKHHPEMAAPQITAHLVDSLKNDPRDFYLVNYANADMVGHSGDFNATVQAIECLDKQLAILYHEVVEKHNGTLYITADHGNAEKKIDTYTGLPSSSHTSNQVYFITLKKGLEGTQLPTNLIGLSDCAPYILKNMEIPVPDEMKR